MAARLPTTDSGTAPRKYALTMAQVRARTARTCAAFDKAEQAYLSMVQQQLDQMVTLTAATKRLVTGTAPATNADGAIAAALAAKGL